MFYPIPFSEKSRKKQQKFWLTIQIGRTLTGVREQEKYEKESVKWLIASPKAKSLTSKRKSDR